MNYNELVSYEIALDLNVKRYDGSEFNYYSGNGNLYHSDVCVTNEDYRGGYGVVCPSYSEVMRWLRDKHHISLNICSMVHIEGDVERRGKYSTYIANLNMKRDDEPFEKQNNELVSIYYDTYEEAIADGVKRALKLI